MSIFLFIVITYAGFGDVIYNSIQQLFWKEVAYQSGELNDARFTLAGRGYIWGNLWEFWLYKQAPFFKWVGDGISRPTHNEFLRILLANGIIGIVLFIIFLLRSVRQVLKTHKKVRVFCLMLLCMFLVDSLGLGPGVYYYYNILIWGLIGFFTINVKVLNEDHELPLDKYKWNNSDLWNNKLE